MLAPDNNIKTYNGHLTWWDSALSEEFSSSMFDFAQNFAICLLYPQSCGNSHFLLCRVVLFTCIVASTGGLLFG